MQPKLPCGHYYGRVARCRDVAGLILTETVYPAGVVPRHSHENAYFCLVRAGAYTERFGGRTRSCGPLTLAYHPAEEVHSEEIHGPEVRSFNIELGPGWRQRLARLGGRLDAPADFTGTGLADLACRLQREFVEPDDVSPLAVEGLALEILAGAARLAAPPQPAPPGWLERAREALRARFAESVSLAELGREAGVHPVYLASAFRRHCRCSVGEYVRRLRVEFARRRLAASDDPLAVIALEAGFADQSHFTRTFKRHTGRTPAEYRRSLRS